jgi:hypothetical protein
VFKDLGAPSASGGPCPVVPVMICEVKALLKYAADRGLDAEGKIRSPLYAAVLEYDVLSDPDRVAATPVPQPRTRDELSITILQFYTELAQLTSPVNGHTLLEARQFTVAVRPLYIWTFVILFGVVAGEVLRTWLADVVEPEDGWLLYFFDFRRYVLDTCSPFLWGALGSCVWILKRLSDCAEQHTFDRVVSHGWITRILLGAILGGIVQYLYDPSVFVSNGFKLGASALGFLTGVGVKVVYGAIEKTIEVLANALNLNAKKDEQAKATAVRTFLSEAVAKADPVTESEKRRILLALIEEVKDPKAP